ncbi:ParB/RepB/Spo0J family partition protein [Dermacoccus sp. 147Ba]|uniref:ParB/RepB/Spo0J family partition protein n=1 Tax=Dermacoccus sp. 147Ba TaxID=2510111 RepID=UPI00101B8B3F|nr:ParB/RepB/Spo0J family partition protein [Dermacoccus sp. 147Ba]RYI20607.1 ParB/RepB/Spo0J family partition protein [Dermacoccus sp. 147Ba]
MATKKAKSGMGGLQLKPRQAGESTHSDSPLVSAVRGGTEQRVRRLRLDEIANNPENPVARSEDVLDELANSLKQVGQLQPGLVVSASEYVAAHPEHAAAIGGKKWVLLAGHRRKAAAEIAGLQEIEVLERTSDRMDETLIHENLHRRALTPIEEASSFQRVMERSNLSQRQMAEHAGVSQTYLARRMLLLKLPEVLQAAIDHGLVATSVGVSLVRDENEDTLNALATRIEKDDADLSHDWVLPAALREARAEVREKNAVEEASKKAADEGVTMIANPAEAFGQNRIYEHQLTTDEEIEEARFRGDLAYVPATAVHADAPVAVRTSKAEGDAPTNKETQDEIAWQKKNAATARRAFILKMVERKPSTREIVEILALAMLSGSHLGAQVTSSARKIAQNVGLKPEADKDREWRMQLLKEKPKKREHLAWITAITALEKPMRNPTGPWTEAMVEFMDYLVDHGYEMSDWEKSEMTKAKKEQA